MSADPQVLVVGSGPTGLLLAVELERRGVGCRLIDASPGPLHWDRATVVHPRSLEVFDTLGLLPAFLDAGVPQRMVRLHSDGEILGEIDLALCGSRYGFNLGISEEVTEAILTRFLERHGGTVVRSSRLVGLHPEPDGVTAEVATEGGTESLRVEWVVGCDGLHSATREAVGIDLAGHDIPEPWAVFDATMEGWPHTYEANFAYLEQLPIILTTLPGGRWRVYVRPSGPDSDLVADARITLARYEPQVRITDVRDPTRFRCHTRVASRYRAGRVLLAGDAAHVCSPAEGHGMNSGLQDAHNLGWKLALVCRGVADATLLDSYEAERRPVAVAITASGDNAERAQTLTDPDERRQRDASLRAAFAGPEGRRHEAVAEGELDIDYRTSPVVLGDAGAGVAPGERLPDDVGLIDPFPATGRPHLLHQLTTGSGHTLFVLSAPDARPGELEAAREAVRAVADPALVDEIVALRTEPDTDTVALTSRGAERLGVTGTVLLAVRPDGHVGLRADAEHAEAVQRYQTLLRRGARHH